ncbi:MAG: lamin tail domain-containing protein, partial [Candidatus Limnocylindria bacterium]
MPSSVPMPMPRGFALLLSLAMVMGAIVPFVVPAPARAAPTDLFFSEYIEGSSFNKALEIYNGTGASIDLSAYSVELYSNGSPDVSKSVTLSGSLASGEVFVVAHLDADFAIQAVTDLVSSEVANFNGDDAIVLRRGTDAVDVIGQVGSDPGDFWGSEPTTTKEHTLVRKANIQAGDTNGADAFDPADEWDAFAQNTFTFIGDHVQTTGPTGIGSADPATVTAGDAVNLTVVVTPGSDPSTGITVTADLGPIGGAADVAFTSTDGVTFTLAATVAAATTPGDKVITATIADAQGRSSTAPIELTVVAPAGPSQVVISQVYGGGGNSDAALTHDFVELFNRSDAAVSVAGWSVQYASATGSGSFGANSGQLTELTGTIPAGGYLLVQGATGGATGSPPPTPDIADPTPINMSGTSGKVALVTDSASLGCNGGSSACDAAALARIVDLVGYGSANFFEGTGAAPGLSNTTAALRNEDGCQDTDDNAADFTEGTPGPRNSASPLNLCAGPPADAAPSVISTIPADGSVGVA